MSYRPLARCYLDAAAALIRPARPANPTQALLDAAADRRAALAFANRESIRAAIRH